MSVLLAACGGDDDSPAPTPVAPFQASVDCASLKTLAIPNTTILSADAVPAGSFTAPGTTAVIADLPDFCRVVATVTPVAGSNIGIEVWLPSKIWNGRYQQVGTHGLGATIYRSEMAPQLRRGFATAATDMGHTAASGPFDPTWAFGNPQRIVDYAYRAVHELADKSKTLIASYYGRAQDYAYYNGCSKGGADGLKSAQLYPQDFNGIIAGGAAQYFTHAATAQLVQNLRWAGAGITGTSGQATLRLAQSLAIAACDRIDGVADGLIANPTRCTWDPTTAVCQAGQDPATCFTPAQAAAIKANYDPVRDPVTNAVVFGGLSRGEEHDSIKFGINSAPFGIALYQIATGDPTWTPARFDLHRDLPLLDQVLADTNATNPDLGAFRKAGGKLIQWHTWDDSQFMPTPTLGYYEQVAALSGGIESTQKFYRLFMVSAQGHCSGDGQGPANFGAENQLAVSNDAEHDMVTALQQWVEHSTAPDHLVVSRYKNNDVAQGIDMQRPVCPYPTEAIYKGSGDTTQATSFYCGDVTPP